MRWKDYIIRRRLSVEAWLASKGVDSIESFKSLVENLGLEQPTEDEINKIFPKPEPLIIKIEEVEKNEPSLNQTKKRAKSI
jgi:hypothetical protein